MIFNTGLNDIMYTYSAALGFMGSLVEDEIAKFNELSNNFSSQSIYNPRRKQSLQLDQKRPLEGLRIAKKPWWQSWCYQNRQLVVVQFLNELSKVKKIIDKFQSVFLQNHAWNRAVNKTFFPSLLQQVGITDLQCVLRLPSW